MPVTFSNNNSNNYEHLLNAKYCSSQFTCINLFNSHKGHKIVISPFYGLENWGTEKLNVQDHTAKCSIQDSSQVSEVPKPIL